MTDAEKMILEALRELLREDLRMDLRMPSAKVKAGWASPTTIGMGCGKFYGQASSWACRYLKRLRDRGLVKRDAPGIYAIAKAGLAELEKP